MKKIHGLLLYPFASFYTSKIIPVKGSYPQTLIVHYSEKFFDKAGTTLFFNLTYFS